MNKDERISAMGYELEVIVKHPIDGLRVRNANGVPRRALEHMLTKMVKEIITDIEVRERMDK